MRVDRIDVYGFEPALRGMRNPMNSWDKSDSLCGFNPREIKTYYFNDVPISTPEYYVIGEKDMVLAKKLIKGGTEHRKFLRQIQVWIDIDIPRYLWTELDTYKVATVRNSCSTMHKLGKRLLTTDDFQDGVVHPAILNELNNAGVAYRRKLEYIAYNDRVLKGYDIVKYMKQLLPEGFLQKATYSFNYETAMSIYYQRKAHRLDEWKEIHPESITSMILSLPYMKEFIE